MFIGRRLSLAIFVFICLLLLPNFALKLRYISIKILSFLSLFDLNIIGNIEKVGNYQILFEFIEDYY